MITVTVEMKRLLKKINALSEALQPDELAKHHATATTGYLKNRVLSRFEEEGDDASGKWAPLAPYTQRERIKEGYHPTYPILRRTGALRKWLMDAPPATSGTQFVWPSQMPPNNSHVMFAFSGAQLGRSNMPRRQIVVVNMRDFLNVKELLKHKISVALNA